MRPAHRPADRPRPPADRRGAVAVQLAVLLPLVVALGVFAMEVAYMHQVRAELRTAADAASRAGTRGLGLTGSEKVARAWARRAAAANPIAGGRLSLRDEEIIFGHVTVRTDGRWPFEPGARPYNGVQVVARRDAGSLSGTVPLMFGSALGTGDFGPIKSAVAVQIDRDFMLVVDRSGSMVRPSDLIKGQSPPYGYVRTDRRNRGLKKGHYKKPKKKSKYPYRRPGDGGPLPNDARWWDEMHAVAAFADELDQTPSEETVGMVTFSDPDGSRNAPTKLEFGLEEDSGRLLDRMEELGDEFYGKATYIHEGIYLAVDSLLADPKRRSWAEPVLVVMTDGKPDPDDARLDVLAAAQYAADRGVTIYAISFTPEADERLMADMAEIGGGTHWHAEDPASLNDAYREIASTVRCVLVK